MSEPAPPVVAPGVDVCGYRLIRRTGESTWLAGRPPPAAGAAGGIALVTITTENDRLRGRVDAHHRVRSPHVLDLIDTATTADGRVVLVTEPTDWSLATLLASRGTLAPGEAVTILGPLVAGLASIHKAGLVLGGVSAAMVQFTRDGRPVIGSLEQARDDPIHRPLPDGGTALSVGVVADFRAWGVLAREIAAVVAGDSASEALGGIASWLDSVLNDGTDLDMLAVQLECRIFAVTPALPVVLVADRSSRGPADTRRPDHVEHGNPLAALQRALLALPAVDTLTGLGGWFRRAIRGRTLATCVGILVMVVIVSAGLIALPPGSGAADAGLVPDAVPASAHAVSTHDPVSQGDSAAVSADDPVGATMALLTIRATCVAYASTTTRTEDCVGGYAEAGSALDEADRYALATDTADGMLLTHEESRYSVELVQAHGDAVLLRAVPANAERQPVLVLVVKTDTGWRLRDLFEPG
ncbi:MAG: hypothetical protein ABWX65_03870 [Mycetocola sp.]